MFIVNTRYSLNEFLLLNYIIFAYAQVEMNRQTSMRKKMHYYSNKKMILNAFQLSGRMNHIFSRRLRQDK